MTDSAALGVLGSTRGTDLQYILDAAESGGLQAAVRVVISDRKSAYILERARKYDIPAAHLSLPEIRKQHPEESPERIRELYDKTVSAVLETYDVDLVLLIGYMRILSPWFCSHWYGRALNIHPSLLPEFAGGMDVDVHAQVLAAGKKETGCTVHLVTADVDSGPIIIQKRCRVEPEDTPLTLKKRVQRLEGAALIEAVEQYRRGSLAFLEQ